MSILAVDIGHPGDLFTLRWRPRDTDIARRWWGCLERALPQGIYERDRIYNFPEQTWNRASIAAAMVECMGIIEQQFPGVFDGLSASEDMSQEHFNLLHTYFEKIRGSIIEPSTFFVAATGEVKRQIDRYNVLIHRWEDHVRNQQALQVKGRGRPRIVCTFNSTERHPLTEQDYDSFSFAHPYGAMVINYTQVGKQLYDVWLDDDDVVGEDAIRPMNCYRANFKAFFYAMSEESHQNMMGRIWEWFDRKANHLNMRGFVKHDPRLALGYLTVADLIPDHDHGTILANVGRLSRIENVRIEGG